MICFYFRCKADARATRRQFGFYYWVVFHGKLGSGKIETALVEESIDSSKDAGKLMITVLSAVAEIERENILVQTMEGRKQKASDGRWNGGFAPYGYKLVNGRLEIAEDEKELIQEIFRLYVEDGLGVNGVARKLNEQGIIKKIRQNGTQENINGDY